MIGAQTRYEDIPEDGLIDVKKKKVRWWEYYLFETEAEYLKWKTWAIEKMKEVGMEKEFDRIDMLYGLNYRLVQTQKAGQLSLL